MLQRCVPLKRLSISMRLQGSMFQKALILNSSVTYCIWTALTTDISDVSHFCTKRRNSKKTRRVPIPKEKVVTEDSPPPTNTTKRLNTTPPPPNTMQDTGYDQSTSHVLNGTNCLYVVMRGCIIFGQEIVANCIKGNSGNDIESRLGVKK
jgi:hypothetical protein